MAIDNCQPGWEGCALAFLALCKVGFCVGVLCALQCAKNCVGQRRRSLGKCQTGTLCPNRVTYNASIIAMRAMVYCCQFVLNRFLVIPLLSLFNQVIPHGSIVVFHYEVGKSNQCNYTRYDDQG